MLVRYGTAQVALSGNSVRTNDSRKFSTAWKIADPYVEINFVTNGHWCHELSQWTEARLLKINQHHNFACFLLLNDLLIAVCTRFSHTYKTKK